MSKIFEIQPWKGSTLETVSNGLLNALDDGFSKVGKYYGHPGINGKGDLSKEIENTGSVEVAYVRFKASNVYLISVKAGSGSAGDLINTISLLGLGNDNRVNVFIKDETEVTVNSISYILSTSLRNQPLVYVGITFNKSLNTYRAYACGETFEKTDASFGGNQKYVWFGSPTGGQKPDADLIYTLATDEFKTFDYFDSQYEKLLSLTSPSLLKRYRYTLPADPSKVYYKETFDDYPVGETRIKNSIPGTGSYEIEELDNTQSQLSAGKKVLNCTSDGTLVIPSDKVYGEWEFRGVTISGGNVIVIQILGDNQDLTDGYNLYLDGTNESISLREITTSLLSSASSFFDNTKRYDFLIQRLSSNSKFPLIGDDVEYNAGTFAVFYRETTPNNSNPYQLVSVSSGSNPVTDNTYTTSKYMVLDFDTNDSISEIIVREGVKQ